MWERAQYPVAPPHEEALETFEVEDAAISAVRWGENEPGEGPPHWLDGAVYDARGQLVPASERVGVATDRVETRNKPHVGVSPDAGRLAGTWLYGGQWFPLFGHFLTESITSLWPLASGVDGLVFHTWMQHPPHVSEWQRDLLDMTRWAGTPVVLCNDAPLRVDRLLVPERGLTVNRWASPEAVDVWSAIGAAAHMAGTPERVFFTRTRFNAASGVRRSTGEWDAALDAAFARRGFAVVAPEELTVTAQVRLAAGAHVLAGSAGSALHLSCFTPPFGRVIEIGDQRSPERPLANQRVIDAACGHRVAFVPHGAAIDAALADLGA